MREEKAKPQKLAKKSKDKKKLSDALRKNLARRKIPEVKRED